MVFVTNESAGRLLRQDPASSSSERYAPPTNSGPKDQAHVAQTEGTNAIAVRLRWVFPKALNPTQVRNHFVTILQDPAVKAELTKYLGNNPALFSQVDIEVKRAINTLIEFHEDPHQVNGA